MMSFNFFYADAETFPGSLSRLAEMETSHAVKLIPHKWHYEVICFNLAAYDYIYNG